MEKDATASVEYHAGPYISPSNIVDKTGGKANAAVIAAATSAAIAQDQDGGFRPYGVNSTNYIYGLPTAGAGVVTITYNSTDRPNKTVTFYSPAITSPAITCGGGADTPLHAEAQILAQLVDEVNTWWRTVSGYGGHAIYISFNGVTGNPTCKARAGGGGGIEYIEQHMNIKLAPGVSVLYNVNRYYVSPFGAPGIPTKGATTTTTNSYLLPGV